MNIKTHEYIFIYYNKGVLYEKIYNKVYKML